MINLVVDKQCLREKSNSQTFSYYQLGSPKEQIAQTTENVMRLKKKEKMVTMLRCDVNCSYLN